MNLFDIIGPVMVGPSSSHTAGAVKIGYAARKLIGERERNVSEEETFTEMGNMYRVMEQADGAYDPLLRSASKAAAGALAYLEGRSSEEIIHAAALALKSMMA